MTTETPAAEVSETAPAAKKPTPARRAKKSPAKKAAPAKKPAAPAKAAPAAKEIKREVIDKVVALRKADKKWGEIATETGMTLSALARVRAVAKRDGIWL